MNYEQSTKKSQEAENALNPASKVKQIFERETIFQSSGS